MNRLCSPDVWIGLACASCAIGVLLAGIGMVCDVSVLRTIGYVLIAPIVIGGMGLVLFVIPILVLANRKHNQKR